MQFNAGYPFFSLFSLPFIQINTGEKIFKGISVSGIPVGGLTKEEADQKLRDNLKYPFEAAFAFTHESDIWHAIPEELGMQIQFDATLEKVWACRPYSKDIFGKHPAAVSHIPVLNTILNRF